MGLDIVFGETEGRIPWGIATSRKVNDGSMQKWMNGNCKLMNCKGKAGQKLLVLMRSLVEEISWTWKDWQDLLIPHLAHALHGRDASPHQYGHGN